MVPKFGVQDRTDLTNTPNLIWRLWTPNFGMVSGHLTDLKFHIFSMTIDH